MAQVQLIVHWLKFLVLSWTQPMTRC